MNDNADVSRSKEKRIEEKEKLEAEAERSLAVARVKQAHKQIEDAEKLRKRSALLSICSRIEYQRVIFINYANALVEIPEEYELSLNKANENAVRNMVRVYESIRYDLQKTIEVNETDFEKLFPRIEDDFGNHGLASSSLLDLSIQMKDMKIYCERLL